MLKSVSCRVVQGASEFVKGRNGSCFTAARCLIAAGAAVALYAAPLGPLTSEPVSATANDWPAQVNADYNITFNGFDIGSFKFQSAINGRGYVLDGDAELSALLGAFKWRGVTRASGNVSSRDPKPAGYTFTFKGAARSGSVKLGFNKDRISNVSLVPPIPDADDTVPVKKEHLKGALDPLSAVMALTRPVGNNGPCERVIPVFDGKQRFDLRLSYRRQEPIKETKQSGQPGIAIVCSVRYVPIAGYSPAEVEQMAENDGIEVALRPVPSANLYVPYEIRIPTVAGSVILSSSRVDIKMTDQQRIALVR